MDVLGTPILPPFIAPRLVTPGLSLSIRGPSCARSRSQTTESFVKNKSSFDRSETKCWVSVSRSVSTSVLLPESAAVRDLGARRVPPLVFDQSPAPHSSGSWERTWSGKRLGLAAGVHELRRQKLSVRRPIVKSSVFGVSSRPW